MEFSDLDYRIDDGILTITLSRPEKMNAVTEHTLDELERAFAAADGDDDVRVIVVTGAGRAFCAGADISSGPGAFDYGEGPHRDSGGRVTLQVFRSRKPVIAAINGPAVGFGATFTLAMDVRLAAENARFGFVFTRRGIVPEACSTWFLPRVVGISRAAEWIFTGRIFGADEAREAGLVRTVHAPADLLPAARALAREMADGTSAVSVAVSRQMLWRMLGEPHPMAAHRVDSRGVQALGRMADAAEGVLSFLERRPPHFTMRPSADMPPFYPWWEEPTFD